MANLQTTTVSGNLTVTGSSSLRATSVSGTFVVTGNSYISGDIQANAGYFGSLFISGIAISSGTSGSSQSNNRT